jgi:hypothetical protein
MKINLPGMFAISLLILLSSIPVGAATDDTNPPPRLTVELRDGSRVVGTSAEKYLKFRSVLLGEIKLDVKDIRAVECVSSNSAKLSTANGDTLTVSFVDSDFAIKTSFGKVDLQMDSVRRFSMSGRREVRAHPPGLVALWAAEGDANDSVGNNNGTLLNGAGFGDGKVGQAFLFDTPDAGVKIPASPALDVGQGGGLTIEGWINPSSLAIRGEIAEWNNGDTSAVVPYGVHLQILSPGELGQGAGNLFSDVHGADGQVHWIIAPGGTITANTFQHVALTYDKESGVAALYCNGRVVAQQNLGSFTPLTSYDFYIGRRPAAVGSVHSFSGSIDELSVYNRALSAAEIQQSYESGYSN